MPRRIRAFVTFSSLVLVALAGPGVVQPSAAGAPSSEIPDRREFPVNPEINPCQDFFEQIHLPFIGFRKPSQQFFIAKSLRVKFHHRAHQFGLHCRAVLNHID